jgi:hypothetical protein
MDSGKRSNSTAEAPPTKTKEPDKTRSKEKENKDKPARSATGRRPRRPQSEVECFACMEKGHTAAKRPVGSKNEEAQS